MPFKRNNYFFSLLLILILFGCKEKSGKLELTYIESDNVEDIYQFEDTLVKPIDYLNLISLEKLPVDERKITFIKQILPSILICKYKLDKQRGEILKLVEKDSTRFSHQQKRMLDSLYTKYKTKDDHELLKRVQTHPVSIVLAQAALESAWGTSRFYSEGNNVFGIWSFSKSDNRMASLGLRNGEPVYLKKYNSLSESIEDYFLVLGRGPFKEFRSQRMETSDPYVLINLLKNYSEKANEYSRLLKLIIKKNNLTQYDTYHIDPEYIK